MSGRDELRGEMATALAEHLGKLGAVIVTPELAAEAVETITDGWRVHKRTELFRDAHGRIQDGGDLQSDPGDQAKHVDLVVYDVDTKPRGLNETEQAVRDKRGKITDWQYGPDRYQAAPPKGVGILALLRQTRWWVTKDKQNMLLIDMAPSHRANLLAFIERQALAYQTAELMSGLYSGAPDGVAEQAADEDPNEWLKRQPLFKRLRKMVKADRKKAKAEAELADES